MMKDAGIEVPYILLPYSLGGAYATYWESNYPEEIEGVVFIAGTQLGDNFDLALENGSSILIYLSKRRNTKPLSASSTQGQSFYMVSV